MTRRGTRTPAMWSGSSSTVRLSKLKRWALAEVVRRAIQVGEAPAELVDPSLIVAGQAQEGSKEVEQTAGASSRAWLVLRRMS